jgi:uncharacterized protein (DUF433 family)
MTVQGLEHPQPILKNEDRMVLWRDASGAMRIGTSRISLDLVVEQYENGMTPEEIVQAYDTLWLADVYQAIGWFLAHRKEFADYFEGRRREAEQLRSEIEGVRPPVTREQLTERRRVQESHHAATGE